MDKPKWQVKSSKILYQSKWLSLIHDEVLTPENKNATYDIIERKNIALVIPKLKENTYCMVEQYRYAVDSFSLEFPQGFCEDIDTKQNALRELEEETGLRAKKLTLLGTFWISAGFLRQKCTVFLAEDFEKGNQKLDDTEIGLTNKILTYEKIVKKVTAGKINNATTIAGLSFLFTKAKS